MTETEYGNLGHSLVALTPEQPFIFPEKEEARLAQIAQEFLDSDTALAEDRRHYQHLFPTHFPTPIPQRLLVDDFTSITHLQHILGLQYYTSRAFVRASQGDIVLGTFAPIEGYIEYMDEKLGLGVADYIPITPSPDLQPYAVCDAYLQQQDAFQALCQTLGARQEELWFHPYMGNQSAWQLADRLQKNLSRNVCVAAPLPELCDRTNNKVWFTYAVQRVLGTEAALPGIGCDSAAKAAQAMKNVAQNWSHVTLKLADSASGMGTGIFSQDELLSSSLPDLEEQVAQWLVAKDWNPNHSLPVLVEPWLREVLGSPSIQLWLPPLGLGSPVVEGIYDQLFYPNNPHIFLGSIPSQLPQRWIQTLSETGATLGRLFQHLGYMGRCSFDTLLSGPDLEHATLHYVECNGRWGGTSTPMTLMNRIFGDYRTRPYIAKDFDDERLKGTSFAQFVETFQDILWDHKTKQGWAIVYNVGCLLPSGKFDIITLGDTFEEAQQRQQMFPSIVNERL